MKLLQWLKMTVRTMFDRLKKLYDEGIITTEGLQNAVGKGWITQEEYDYIIGA